MVSSDSQLNHYTHHLSKNWTDPIWESCNTGVMITFPHSQMIIFSSENSPKVSEHHFFNIDNINKRFFDKVASRFLDNHKKKSGV